jgi:hypothetical protein
VKAAAAAHADRDDLRRFDHLRRLLRLIVTVDDEHIQCRNRLSIKIAAGVVSRSFNSAAMNTTTVFHGTMFTDGISSAPFSS